MRSPTAARMTGIAQQGKFFPQALLIFFHVLTVSAAAAFSPSPILSDKVFTSTTLKALAPPLAVNFSVEFFGFVSETSTYSSNDGEGGRI